MGFVPNNLCVYIYAFCGCQAGLVASGKYPNDPSENDYDYASLKADAYAQAIDEAWGSGAYTNADLQQLFGCSYGIWALGRSPIADPTGNEPAAYGGVAIALVAAVRSGTRQIVSEGIDPNGCGGGGGDGGSGGVLVWRPGGTFETGVVTTWAEVASAIASSNVPLTVYVDSSIAAAIIPGSSGVTDCRGTTRLLSYNWSTVSLTYSAMVEIEDGATLYRLREIGEGLDVLCDAVTTASLAFAAGLEIDVFTVRDFARLRTGGSAAVGAIQLAAGQKWQLYTRGNVTIDVQTAAPLVELSSTSVVDWTAVDELTVNVSASVLFTGSAGAKVSFIHDLSAPLLAFATWGFSGTVIDDRLYSAPGTPAYDPVWYALTDVYLDPVSGSDSNSGASSGEALQTMAQVVQRYGSSSPQMPYGQSLTIHQLSAQTAGVDAFYFNPKMSGGGSFSWVGSLTAVGAPFSPASISAKSQTSGGSQLKLNGSLPAGAAVGQVVEDTTRTSFGLVLAIAGGDATVAQPLTISTATVPASIAEDNGWVDTDSFQLYAPLLCNWKNPAPQGGDTNAGQTDGFAAISGVQFADASGTAAKSQWTVRPVAIQTTIFNCLIDPNAMLDGTDVEAGNYNGLQLANCRLHTHQDMSMTILGGVSLGFAVNVGAALWDCDTSLAGGAYCSGAGSVIGSAQVNGHTLQIAAQVFYEQAYGPNSIIWGSGTVNVTTGGNLQNETGSSFATTLLVGALQLDGATTGSSFNRAAVNNPFTAAIALTSANIDTGGGAGNPGLQNPRTGSRYCLT